MQKSTYTNILLKNKKPTKNAMKIFQMYVRIVVVKNSFTFLPIFVHEPFPNTGRLQPKRKGKWAQIGSKEKAFHCVRSL